MIAVIEYCVPVAAKGDLPQLVGRGHQPPGTLAEPNAIHREQVMHSCGYHVDPAGAEVNGKARARGEPKLVSVEGHDPVGAGSSCPVGQEGHFEVLVEGALAVEGQVDAVAAGQLF